MMPIIAIKSRQRNRSWWNARNVHHHKVMAMVMGITSRHQRVLERQQQDNNQALPPKWLSTILVKSWYGLRNGSAGRLSDLYSLLAVRF